MNYSLLAFPGTWHQSIAITSISRGSAGFTGIKGETLMALAITNIPNKTPSNVPSASRDEILGASKSRKSSGATCFELAKTNKF